ncbi:hypothetical protein B0T25DRAFT_324713 [Lasiosphaeria hispida]|uniref:Actin-like ATPase domain-containing protein n=1 Tax=Lasiosphaeria hispida TaxID=260671 RepID=A0AAJ0MA79_9PEZI|nr:hypothetical protein B0T25DRAFT_324713 [Lasiosphaeria hispida]
MSMPMGSTTPLPHRSVANIKSPAGGGSGPSTPMRSLASNFGSPSSLRAEEDLIVIEFGTRKLQVGFAGDAAPRGAIWFSPEQQRRVGDFRVWQADYQNDWKKRSYGNQWGRDHELWQSDVRGLDLGLVGDKIERALREAFTKYLLIDSRPRRLVCVLPSDLPIPMLSVTLDTLFNRFQPPTVALLSPPVALAVGAGIRSALVIDLGWSETVVTSIYEYREVHTNRSIRGGRMLTEETHRFLARHLVKAQGEPDHSSDKNQHELSFEECEEIASRLVWCKPSRYTAAAQPGDGLATVQEQDESDIRGQPSAPPTTTSVPLKSAASPTTLEISCDQLAEPCETTFFDPELLPSSFDDHELPLHLLVYRSLLQLPLDVRAICMSRIIFTGGCASVLGLRRRVFDEVSHLARERGWDPVQGKAVEQLRINPLLKKRGTRQAGSGPTGVESQPGSGEEQDGVWHDAANTTPEVDPVEEQLRRGSDKRPRVHGEMRAVESLGAWSGASMISYLKAPAIATIDRDIWLQQGAAGATNASDIDPKTQRQSLGAGGLIRGAAPGSAWTLGIWGAA